MTRRGNSRTLLPCALNTAALWKNVLQTEPSGPPKGHALPSLTGIRGIAALGVFLSHFQLVIFVFLGLNPNRELHFITNGFRGVSLFFILSGFILYYVHSHDFSENIRFDKLVEFFTLRFFRVYPLNTAVLLILIPVVVLLPGYVLWHRATHASIAPSLAYHLHDFSRGAFIQGLLLLQNWTGLKLGTWNEPAWSLSAETVGYAAFPFFAFFAARLMNATRAAGAAILSLVLLTLIVIRTGHTTDNETGLFGTLGMAFCFFAGIGLCRCFQLLRLTPVAARMVTSISAAVTLVCLAVDSAGVFAVFGFSGLIFGLAYQTGTINAILTSRTSMFLGKISFSFYMVHLIPLDLFVWLTSVEKWQFGVATKLALLAALAISAVLLSVVTYMLVEVPFQRLGRRVSAAISEKFARCDVTPRIASSKIVSESGSNAMAQPNFVTSSDEPA